MTDLGVCENAQCERAARREPIERYPGPGQYCPDCGEPLRPLEATPPPPVPSSIPPVPAPPPIPSSAAVASTSAAARIGAALWPKAPPPPEGAEGAPAAAPEPAPAAASLWTAGRRRSAIIAASVVGVLALIAVAAVGGTRSVAALAVRVCSSTMTDRVANEMLRAYSAGHHAWPYHYDITRAGDTACDVRFRAAPAGADDSVIGRDGVVAIVNPQNPIARISIPQVRDILAGRISDWSQVGGRPGAINVIVPDDGSDEAQIVNAKLMLGQPFGPQVVRSLATGDITRTVSSPSGVRSIGIVPFSDALPAKVIALGYDAPPPSTLSIADDRYPLAVRIIAESDFRSPSRPAADLIAFAHSADANDILARSALIRKNGL